MIQQICLMFIISTTLLLVQLKQNEKLRRNFKIYKAATKCEIENLKKKLLEETARADMLEQNRVRKFYSKELCVIPIGTLEAVKYAMNKSHPDNGGKQEDFIKLRKIYEELKGTET